jgi:uncharacterized protein YjdB
MFGRDCFKVLGLICLVLPFTGCSNTQVSSIQISPASQSLTVGQPVQFTATGTIAHGSHPSTSENVTDEVTWASSTTAVATMNSSGLATAVGAGTTTILASMPGGGGPSATATITVTASSGGTGEPLASLAIVPAAQTLTVANQTAGLIAIGTTAGGTTVNLTNMPATIGSATIKAATWSSSVVSVAAINPLTGVATAVGNGTTVITAFASNPDGTVVTGTATVTVNIPATPEPLASLAIVPAAQTLTAANQTAGLIAIGTTSSGATVNLTGVPATVGSATIKAAAWSSSVSSVATVNPVTGVATAAVANGTTVITAIATNPDGTVVTGTATLTVNIPATPEPLLSLAIVPSSQSVASAGQTTQFLAIGNFSTSSSTPGSQNMANVSGYTVAWSSSNPSVAAINPLTGVATAVGQGATAISVVVTNNADKSGATATATFTVTGPAAETIAALSIFPGSQTITLPLPGSPLQTASYVAIGTNGTTDLQNTVTGQMAWSSTNPLVATVDSTGTATALSQGTTTITAIATNKDGSVVTATATLTVAGVASEPLLSLAIIPGSDAVSYPGQTGQFTAIGTFTPTSTTPVTQNLTKTVTWSSSNSAVATVGTNSGLVTAKGPGTAVIMAVGTNPDTSVVTATATFTVENAASQLVSAVTIYPGSVTVAAAQTAQLIVLGMNGTTGLQSDVTTSTALTWVPSNPKIATVATVGNYAVVTGVAVGSTTIIAEYTNPDTSVVTATAQVTVSAVAEPLVSLAIVPSGVTLTNIDETAQFLAIGTTSTGDQQDLTDTVAWSSNEIQVATLNSTGGAGPTTGGLGSPAGLATVVGPGTTAITAVATNPDNTVVTGVASLTCPPSTCGAPEAGLLATLTVFGAGNNTQSWLVTALSATDAPNAIYCGPGGTTAGGPVCVGTYPVGTSVTLRTDVTSGTFGGWSSNCTVSPNPSTQTGVNTCTVVLSNNETVAGIFN